MTILLANMAAARPVKVAAKHQFSRVSRSTEEHASCLYCLFWVSIHHKVPIGMFYRNDVMHQGVIDQQEFFSLRGNHEGEMPWHMPRCIKCGNARKNLLPRLDEDQPRLQTSQYISHRRNHLLLDMLGQLLQQWR